MKRILLILCAIAAPAFSQQKPNALFLLSDDQSYETIRAFGHTKFQELQKRYDDKLDQESIFPELD